MNGEFLKLLQAVEAGRKCDGKECIEVSQDDLAKAEANDTARSAHEMGSTHGSDGAGLCPGCEESRQRDAALRETFRARRVDLPVGILES